MPSQQRQQTYAMRAWPLAFTHSTLEKQYLGANIGTVTAADDRQALASSALCCSLVLNLLLLLGSQQYTPALICFLSLYRFIPTVLLFKRPALYAQHKRTLMLSVRVFRLFMHIVYLVGINTPCTHKCLVLRQGIIDVVLSGVGNVVMFPTLQRDHDLINIFITMTLLGGIRKGGACAAYVGWCMWVGVCVVHVSTVHS